MDHDRLRKILKTLQANEVEDVLNFVKSNEQAGRMTVEEAEEWRRQIRTRQMVLLRDEGRWEPAE